MKTIAIIYSEEHVLDALDKLLTKANFEVIPYFDPEDALRDTHLVSPSLDSLRSPSITPSIA